MKIEKFSEMLEAIQKERGIPKEALIEAIRAALSSAAKKLYREHIETEFVDVKLEEDGLARIFVHKKVVNQVEHPSMEISLKDAKKVKSKVKLGEDLEVEVTPSDFGRVAAQTAKQVIIQRIREAEKDGAYEEFHNKEGELVTGFVQRRERHGYLINLGRIETVLPVSEQIPGEIYRPKDKIKLFIVETRKTPKGPMVVVSRANPGLVRRLFELEVPEIEQGILEIKFIAREAGRRTKVAVLSKDKNIAAVGTCVGHMGNRIQNIVRELGNERVDIVEWNEKPEKFITNSLSPAKIASVKIDKESNSAKVIVPENQLSLAIGKEGQNVRLAAKLTGYKIDIVNESEIEEAKTVEKKPVEEKKEVFKIKVKDVAEETGLTSKEVIAKLKELEIEAKSATSVISAEDKNKLINKINSEGKSE